MSDCCQNETYNERPLHIAIIGTGSGAFAAAIKACENGAKVSIIEGSELIGGTCVNIGCVPSKILIKGAQIAHQQNHHAFDGIKTNTPLINRKSMVAQQQNYVASLRYEKYQKILETNPNIHLIRGWASFKNTNTLSIKNNDGEHSEITADKILIAVGAKPAIPNIKGLTNTPYWTSTEALVATTLPKHLVVLGGSVVALELAQAFLRLGTKVTLIARSVLLSKEEANLGEQLKIALEKEGMNIILNTVPTEIQHQNQQFVISLGQQTITCEQLLVATGRQSNADQLALKNANIASDAQHNVKINAHCQTNIPHIYAVGDCTTMPQYVYVAAAAGTCAAKNMTGETTKLNLSPLPAVVFTAPQVASVGLTEQQAQQKNIATLSRTLPLENVPRAIANMDTFGFIKLVADKNTHIILGCQILADQAAEVIQSASLAIQNKMTVEQLAQQLFPYLTMVEGLKLTAQTFNKDISQLSCCAG